MNIFLALFIGTSFFMELSNGKQSFIGFVKIAHIPRGYVTITLRMDTEN